MSYRKENVPPKPPQKSDSVGHISRPPILMSGIRKLLAPSQLPTSRGARSKSPMTDPDGDVNQASSGGGLLRSNSFSSRRNMGIQGTPKVNVIRSASLRKPSPIRRPRTPVDNASSGTTTTTATSLSSSTTTTVETEAPAKVTSTRSDDHHSGYKDKVKMLQQVHDRAINNMNQHEQHIGDVTSAPVDAEDIDNDEQIETAVDASVTAEQLAGDDEADVRTDSGLEVSNPPSSMDNHSPSSEHHPTSTSANTTATEYFPTNDDSNNSDPSQQSDRRSASPLLTDITVNQHHQVTDFDQLICDPSAANTSNDHTQSTTAADLSEVQDTPRAPITAVSRIQRLTTEIPADQSVLTPDCLPVVDTDIDKSQSIDDGPIDSVDDNRLSIINVDHPNLAGDQLSSGVSPSATKPSKVVQDQTTGECSTQSGTDDNDSLIDFDAGFVGQAEGEEELTELDDNVIDNMPVHAPSVLHVGANNSNVMNTGTFTKSQASAVRANMQTPKPNMATVSPLVTKNGQTAEGTMAESTINVEQMIGNIPDEHCLVATSSPDKTQPGALESPVDEAELATPTGEAPGDFGEDDQPTTQNDDEPVPSMPGKNSDGDVNMLMSTPSAGALQNNSRNKDKSNPKSLVGGGGDTIVIEKGKKRAADPDRVAKPRNLTTTVGAAVNQSDTDDTPGDLDINKLLKQVAGVEMVADNQDRTPPKTNDHPADDDQTLFFTAAVPRRMAALTVDPDEIPIRRPVISSADDDDFVANDETPVVQRNGAPTESEKKTQKPVAVAPQDLDAMFSPANIEDLTDDIPSGSIDEVVNKLKVQFQAVLLAKEREWSTRLQKEHRKFERSEEDKKQMKKDLETSKFTIDQHEKYAEGYRRTVQQACDELIKVKAGKSSTLNGEDLDCVVRERDQALDDLQAVENSFADLHRRYEKLRAATEEFKKNEDQLKQSLASIEIKCQRFEDRYVKLREHAEGKLEKANNEIDRLQRQRETDTLSLRAQLKKRELQVDTLEKSLEHKNKEIQELTAICDELIQKAAVN